MWACVAGAEEREEVAAAESALLALSEVVRVFVERRTWWPAFHFEPRDLQRRLPSSLPAAAAAAAVANKAVCAVFLGGSASYTRAAEALLGADSAGTDSQPRDANTPTADKVCNDGWMLGSFGDKGRNVIHIT